MSTLTRLLEAFGNEPTIKPLEKWQVIQQISNVYGAKISPCAIMYTEVLPHRVSVSLLLNHELSGLFSLYAAIIRNGTVRAVLRKPEALVLPSQKEVGLILIQAVKAVTANSASELIEKLKSALTSAGLTKVGIA